MSTPNYLQLPDTLTPLDEDQISVLTSIGEEGDTSLLQELVETFVRDNEPRFQTLAETCKAKDLAALRQHTHFIAGSTANLGIARVARLCRQVEKAILDNEFNAFDEFPQKLNTEYKTGMSELKTRAGLN